MHRICQTIIMCILNNRKIEKRVKIFQIHTINAAIDCSTVSISIRAILRSFSKNLNLFIVPYCEKILRISSSLVSVLKNQKVTLSTIKTQLFFLHTEYLINVAQYQVGKYYYNFLNLVF